MVTSKKKMFIGMSVFLLAVFVMALAPVSTVLALNFDEGHGAHYAENSIYFYDPDASPIECEEMGSGDDPVPVGSGEWDGHCSNVESYGSKINQYYNSIHSVAQRNGLPWEGIVAQLIGESSFMSKEVCPFNPLGLKGSPSCDGKHRSFNSYDEAFNYYVNSIRPVRAAMGKFKNDPYGYINFLINGVPGYKYATDPQYVNKISGYVCGVQRWARANGKQISGSGASNTSNNSGGDADDENEDTPYCDNPEEEEGGDEDGDCEENGTCNDYVFPLKGATKSNYLNGNSLSPLPCKNLSMGGCHHDYFAMDLGLSTGTKSESNYPDLIGKFSAYYWKSVGVKVVAMSSGKIIGYRPYSRATMGYVNKCASVTFRTDDGRTFWLGHMLYDSKYKAGDHFGTGDVIGEVGPPPCAIGTQAHLHVDETPSYGKRGSVETVKLINRLYEELP